MQFLFSTLILLFSNEHNTPEERKNFSVAKRRSKRSNEVDHHLLDQILRPLHIRGNCYDTIWGEEEGQLRWIPIIKVHKKGPFVSHLWQDAVRLLYVNACHGQISFCQELILLGDQNKNNFHECYYSFRVTPNWDPWVGTLMAILNYANLELELIHTIATIV